MFINRRKFIKSTGISVAAFALPEEFISKQKPPKLSFSTLGCPKWSLPEIVEFAALHEYQGIEIRTIQGELNLPKCPAFSKANRSDTIKMIADNGLVITDLGSSANMHHVDEILRQNNLDQAKRYIDLAANLRCPYVRVFPDKLPKDNNRKKILDAIVEALNELGAYTKGTGVRVLMESHGDLVQADELQFVMEQAPKNVAMIWDILNMWALTKEPPSLVFNKLKKHIKHIHVKDAVFVNGQEKFVLLGKGEAPIKEAIQIIHKSNFKGFYSFEWEKMWHPEIEEPEVALAHYPKEILKYF